jgi:hypothetical protein
MRTTFWAFMAFCLGLLLAPLAQAQSSNAGAAAGALSGSASQSGAQSGAAAGAVINQEFASPPANTRQDLDYSGTYTIKNVPNAIAPNIYPSANCHGSTGVGGAVAGFGVTFGSSWQDEDCQYRETARMFHQMGMNGDAVAVLCSSPFAVNAPACAKPAQQPTADAGPSRKDAARDGDDSKRRKSAATKVPDSDFSADVNLPDSEFHNTEIVAAADGRLWRKRNGDWIEVASNGQDQR